MGAARVEGPTPRRLLWVRAGRYRNTPTAVVVAVVEELEGHRPIGLGSVGAVVVAEGELGGLEGTA